ncbi:hypothetical protein FHY12_002865 [Xanthomonas arboricola]|uniref:hypothetical protein n=1 Tax=Xanthomonas euroxanthea TaxID=2259622 RepID=UPI00141AEC35|nr:hypothetical protein [Xanthomonas euroxanthea]NIK40540.1 hypothetical protein [Xanthomonas euroxanthea]
MTKEEANIADLLTATAKNCLTCTFQQVFSLFPKNADPTDVYRALDNAARSISPPEIANYSALMAKKDTGCPGDGFFDTFKLKRLSEYEQIAGVNTLTLDLSTEQKEAITAAERSRVYAHAIANHA